MPCTLHIPAVVVVGGGDPPPSGNFDPLTNRPGTGWTTWTDRTWSDADRLEIAGAGNTFTPLRTADGWDEAYAASGALPEFVSGFSGDPNGDGRILRQTYNGTPDGAEPKFLNNAISATTEVFMTFIVRFAPTFLWPQNSGLKWLIFGNGVSGWLGCGRVANAAYSDTSLPATREACQFSVDFNPGHGSPTRLRHDVNWSFPRGQWSKIQLWVRIGGGGDRCQVWVDDVLRIDGTAVGWTAGASMPNVNNLEVCSTWGGGVGVAGYAGTDVEFDRIVIYRK